MSIVQEMRVPRSTSSSTKRGKGDQKHGTLEAATGVCSTSSKEIGTQPPWGRCPFSPRPLWVVQPSSFGWCCCPSVGGAAFSTPVTVLSSLTGSLRRWRRGNASRQTKPQDQCKTVTLGHHSHSLSLLPSSPPPSLSPLSLPLSSSLFPSLPRL